MKFKNLRICLSLMMIFSLFGCMNNDTEETVDEEPLSILITYYSHSGNTQEVSSMIQNEIGGTIEEIFTVKNYPAKYDDLLPVAQQEKDDNERPELAQNARDPKDFDIIYLGFPIWCDTMPMAMYTYLEQYDFTDKIIIPFATSTEGDFGESIDDIKTLCPNAIVMDPLMIKDSDLTNASKQVHEWLDAMGMLKEDTK